MNGKKVDEPVVIRKGRVVVAGSNRKPLDEEVEQRERGGLAEWPVCQWRDVWTVGDEPSARLCGLPVV